MYFVLLGVLLVVLKLLELGPVGQWGWLAVLWPFGVAFLWWAYADKAGITKRREMNKMEEKKAERRRKHMIALGINPRERERSARIGSQRSAEAAKVEGERDDARERNKEAIARSSRFGGLDPTQR